MIFASDLDQTLIYSQPEDRAAELGSRIVIAELIDGKVRSYMSADAFQLLKELMAQLTFIPVTTRTLHQYFRIHLVSQILKPAYAVTSNGGNIVIDGQPDLEWQSHILNLVKQSSSHVEEVRRLMEQVLHPEWVISSSYCDELFFSHIVQRDKIPRQEVSQMIDELRRMGWNTSIQGRKIYVVPAAVNKRDAVAHLKTMLGDDKIIASGDSLLDQILLDFADYAIAPRHGELFRQEQLQQTGEYKFTEASGIFATDEILAYVQTLPNENHHSFRIKESS
ncbi:HAD family hydrolase [Paenibacillus sp. GCM10023248]|uniref:HAD family hydrolase n=1 Tax=unclassified Paenibacillus TaxID=185978 RepID=UPI0023785103|nr:HAD family hydrolase [Paenibacillus sp. MAHUQ-63]MDD9271228.1 HAD family hydrolase [Paenibacillus sp. MAHUQ-63]